MHSESILGRSCGHRRSSAVILGAFEAHSKDNRGAFEVVERDSYDTRTALVHSGKSGSHAHSRPNAARLIDSGAFAGIRADSK